MTPTATHTNDIVKDANVPKKAEETEQEQAWISDWDYERIPYTPKPLVPLSKLSSNKNKRRKNKLTPTSPLPPSVFQVQTQEEEDVEMRSDTQEDDGFNPLPIELGIPLESSHSIDSIMMDQDEQQDQEVSYFWTRNHPNHVPNQHSEENDDNDSILSFHSQGDEYEDNNGNATAPSALFPKVPPPTNEEDYDDCVMMIRSPLQEKEGLFLEMQQQLPLPQFIYHSNLPIAPNPSGKGATLKTAAEIVTDDTQDDDDGMDVDLDDAPPQARPQAPPQVPSNIFQRQQQILQEVMQHPRAPPPLVLYSSQIHHPGQHHPALHHAQPHPFGPLFQEMRGVQHEFSKKKLHAMVVKPEPDIFARQREIFQQLQQQGEREQQQFHLPPAAPKAPNAVGSKSAPTFRAVSKTAPPAAPATPPPSPPKKHKKEAAKSKSASRPVVSPLVSTSSPEQLRTPTTTRQTKKKKKGCVEISSSSSSSSSSTTSPVSVTSRMTMEDNHKSVSYSSFQDNIFQRQLLLRQSIQKSQETRKSLFMNPNPEVLQVVGSNSSGQAQDQEHHNNVNSNVNYNRASLDLVLQQISASSRRVVQAAKYYNSSSEEEEDDFVWPPAPLQPVLLPPEEPVSST
jgi:hypothetical protein